MKRYRGSVRFGDALRRARGPEEYEYLARTEKADRQLNLKLSESLPYSDTEKRYQRLIEKIDDPKFQARRAKKIGMKTTSIRELAKKVGVSKNTLLDYEAGRRYPPLEFVIEVCVALEIRPDGLVRKWFNWHPNENMHALGNLGFVTHTFRNRLGKVKGNDKSNLIRFIATAINLAHHHATEWAPDLSRQERISQISLVTAYLMQEVMANGQPIHPSSISANFNAWEGAIKTAEAEWLKKPF
nr:helix-turn-helix transcriptional regulator [Oceanococcus sp. HetDA_MAG_MS8]